MIAFLKAKGTPLTFQSIKIAFWGGIALGLNVAFFFESLKRTTVVNATIIGSLQPVLISVYSYKVFKEKVTPRCLYWSYSFGGDLWRCRWFFWNYRMGRHR